MPLCFRDFSGFDDLHILFMCFDGVIFILAYLGVDLSSDRPVGIVRMIQMMPILSRENIAAFIIFKKNVGGKLLEYFFNTVKAHGVRKRNSICDPVFNNRTDIWFGDAVKNAGSEAVKAVGRRIFVRINQDRNGNKAVAVFYKFHGPVNVILKIGVNQKHTDFGLVMF